MIQQSGNSIEIIDLINDGIIIHDAATGAIMAANQASRDMFGYTRGEFLKLNLDDICDVADISEPDSVQDQSDAFSRILQAADNGARVVEWRFRRRSGSLFWGEVSLKKARIENVDRVIATIRDITDRKDAEQQLKTERERLLSILNGLPAFVCMQDSDHKLHFVNKYVCDHFGTSTRLNCHELIAGVRQCCGGCPMSEVFGDHEIRVVEKRLADGRIYQIHNFFIPDLDGTPLLLHIGFDITERKAMEEDLREAKARAELYVDLMAHDIGNMNHVAMGYLELGEQLLGLEGDDRLYLEKPVEMLQKSTRLIDQVRKIQAAASGNSHLKPVDVTRLLTVLREQYRTFPGKDLDIELRTNGPCSVKANDLLRDIFSNLVENAIKHSGAPQVRIGLSAEAVGGRCLVAIEDHGPGIPDQIKQMVFSRSYRGKKSSGSGLGLYLVRTLTESFGGTVRAEDRVPGDHTQGSRFVIELPAA